MNIKEKRELLLKPCWTFKDIQNYFECSQQKAFNIKKTASEEGSVPYGKQYVKTDVVLKLYGTSRENELKTLNVLDDEKI